MWTVSHWDPRLGLVEDATAHDQNLARACRNDYVQHGLIPASAFIAPAGTQPRPMLASELTPWTCPVDGQAADSGTSYLDDRGPYQQILVRQFTCPDSHRWQDENDGG
jgi:hypothetical protein